MLGIIATLKIQDGKQAGFEALMNELTAKVRAHEAGFKLYQLHQTAYATVYVLLEQSVHMAPFDAHMVTHHSTDSARHSAPLLALLPAL